MPYLELHSHNTRKLYQKARKPSELMREMDETVGIKWN